MSPEAAALAEQLQADELNPPIAEPIEGGGSEAATEPSPIRSTRTTTEPTPDQLDSLATVFGIVFMLLGKLLHFTRTPGPNLVWIPTPGDVAAVSGPASRLVARHAPTVNLDGAEDVTDVIELVGGTIAYGVRSIEEEHAVKAAARTEEPAA